MYSYPIQAILMYFAMLFAPDNVDRITLETPDPSIRIEMVRNGKTWSAEGDAFGIEGDNLLAFGADGKETLRMGDFIALPKNHDWDNNPEFTLGGGTTLRKSATGFILRRNSTDGEGNGTYKIVYHKRESKAGSMTVNVLGKVANQGVHRLSASGTVRDALAEAGGADSGADMKRVSILRGPAGTLPQVTSIDLADEDEPGLAVQSGDTIYVAESEEQSPVGDMALQWLAGIDAADYERSWNDASGIFRTSITSADWGDTMKKLREPLGAVKSRKTRDMKMADTLPGAPDGKYWIIQFDSSFAGKAEAVETVTFMLEKDGTWKAAGYFIR